MGKLSVGSDITNQGGNCDAPEPALSFQSDQFCSTEKKSASDSFISKSEQPAFFYQTPGDQNWTSPSCLPCSFSADLKSQLSGYKEVLADPSPVKIESSFRSLMDQALVEVGASKTAKEVNMYAAQLKESLCVLEHKMNGASSGDCRKETAEFMSGTDTDAIGSEIEQLQAVLETKKAELEAKVAMALAYACAAKGAPLGSKEEFIISEALEAAGAYELGIVHFNKALELKASESKIEAAKIEEQIEGVIDAYKKAAPKFESMNLEYGVEMIGIKELKKAVTAAKEEREKIVQLKGALEGKNDELLVENLAIAQGFLNPEDNPFISGEEGSLEADMEALKAFAKNAVIYEALGYFSDEYLTEKFGEDLDVDENALAEELGILLSGLDNDIVALEKDIETAEIKAGDLEKELEPLSQEISSLSEQFITLDLLRSGLIDKAEQYADAVGEDQRSQIEADVSAMVNESQKKLKELKNSGMSEGLNAQFSGIELSSADHDKYGSMLESVLFKGAAADQYVKASEQSSTKAEKYYYLTKAYGIGNSGTQGYILISELQKSPEKVDVLLAEAKEWEKTGYDMGYVGEALPDSAAESPGLPGTPEQVHILKAEMLLAQYQKLLGSKETTEEEYVMLENKALKAMQGRTGEATMMEAAVYGQLTSSINNRYTKFNGKIFNIFAHGDEFRTEQWEKELKEQDKTLNFSSIDEGGFLTYTWFDIDKDWYLETLGEKTKEVFAKEALQDQFTLLNTYKELCKPLSKKQDNLSESLLDKETNLTFNGFLNGLGLPVTALKEVNGIVMNNPDSIAVKDYLRTIKAQWSDFVIAGKPNISINKYSSGTAEITKKMMLLSSGVVSEANWTKSKWGYGAAIAAFLLGGGLLAAMLAAGLTEPIAYGISSNELAEGTPQYAESLAAGFAPLSIESAADFDDASPSIVWQVLEGGFDGLLVPAAFGLARTLLLGAKAGTTGGLVNLIKNAGLGFANVFNGETTLKAMMSEALGKDALRNTGKFLRKWAIGKSPNGAPPPLDPKFSLWKKIGQKLGWYKIYEETGQTILINKATKEMIVKNIAGQYVKVNIAVDAAGKEVITLTGEVVKDISGFTPKLLGAKSVGMNSYDALMTAGEKIATPIWVGDYLLTEEGIIEKTQNKPMSNLGAFFFMLFCTRIGHERLGINKNGQRLIFWFDRLGDYYEQVTSGQSANFFKMNFWYVALNYGTGTLVGQARGWWLMSAMAKIGLGGGKSNFLLTGKAKPSFLKWWTFKVVKTEDVLVPGEAKYLYKQTLKSKKFAYTGTPGTEAKSKFFGAIKSMDTAEQELSAKILNASNANLVVGITPEGQLVKKSLGKKLFCINGYSPTQSALSSEEQQLFAKMMGKGSFAELFGKGQDMIKVVSTPMFSGQGLLAFSLLHDTVIGSIWDGFRYANVLNGSFSGAFKWTFARSGTTLPLQNIIKLFFGWDTPRAGIASRLFPRNTADVYLTKFYQLWEGKGLFVYGMDDNMQDVESKTDLMEMLTTGLRWYDAGGLSRYKLPKINDIFNPWADEEEPRYQPIGEQHLAMAQFILGKKVGKNPLKAKTIEDKFKIHDDDLVKLDKYITELASYVIDKQEGEPVKDEVDESFNSVELLDETSSLAAMVYYIRKYGGEKYFPEFAKTHSQLLSQIETVWQLVEKEVKTDKKFNPNIPLEDQVLISFIDKVGKDTIDIMGSKELNLEIPFPELPLIDH